MFSIKEIKASESKIKTGTDFPQFIKEIKEMGVVRNDVYVSTGLCVYFDNDDYSVQTSPDEYPPSLVINDESSADKLKHALEVHQQGETDYFTFCKQAADAGVEKWIIDLNEMTCSYLDTEQKELIKEEIPSA